MLPLFTKKELDEACCKDKLPFICECCCKKFLVLVQRIREDFGYKTRLSYCSTKCSFEGNRKAQKDKCGWCDEEIWVRPCEKRKSISGLNFCSTTCSDKHSAQKRNKHHEKFCARCNKPISVGNTIVKDKNYCSLECFNQEQKDNGTAEKTICAECGNIFIRHLSQKKKATNHFCCQPCYLAYQSKHQSYRSKLEQWIENKIRVDFPNLDVIFNDRKLLFGLELDIYFPNINLAFELNGPTHYQPIYGEKSLKKTQKNDKSKKTRCEKLLVKLIVIDTSKHCYSCDKNNMPFYEQIKKIIDETIKKVA